MSFWKSRADIQDRYRRELFAGTVVACNADGSYDVALPGAAEPVRGVANAGELRFQEGNRVVVTRAGGRDGWQIHAGMAAGAPTRAFYPEALLDAPPLIYWGGLARSGSEAESIVAYVDGKRWPLAALLPSGAADGQAPVWSEAAGAWVPATPAGGVSAEALRALAAAGLAGCIGGAQRPRVVPPCVGGWLMVTGTETDPDLSSGAFVYSAAGFEHIRAGAYPVQLSTLAYWKLDEASSSEGALDCSGHLRDLTPHNMESSVAGAFYGARQWNGVNSYLDRAALPTQNGNQFCIEAWVKPDSLANNPMLFYQEGSVSLQFEDGGAALRIYMITGGAVMAQATTDPAVLCDGNWHYLAGVYDGATLRLYVDGQQNGTTPAQSGNVAAAASTNCYLGVYAPSWTSWSRYYDGALDEVRLTQGAVSASEVAAAWAGRAAQRAVTARFTAPSAWSRAMLGDVSVLNGGTVDYTLSADDGATWTPAAAWDWTTPPAAGTQWRIRAVLSGKAEIHRLGLVGI